MGLKEWLLEKVLVSVLKKAVDSLRDKKTFIILGVALILALIKQWNDICPTIGTDWCRQINIPDWVFAVLAGLGLYTRTLTQLRINKLKASLKRAKAAKDK